MTISVFVFIFVLMILFLNVNFKRSKIYFFSNLNFLMSIFFLMGFFFYEEWMFISYNFGLNIYNFMMLMLIIWIFSLVYMILINLYNLVLCLNILMLLEMFLILNFLSMDLMMFYLFFEFSLFFTFYLIIKWGLGFMRLLAGYYFLFYTMFFSLPLLFFLMKLLYEINSSVMMIIELKKFELEDFMFLYMMMAFFVKIPLYLFHGWLLKAHVEAPVFGSMILASVLLKLGTYGLLRFILMFFKNFLKINWFILMLSLIGCLIISLMNLRQIDMKILVAYSSVVHMGLMVMGMMTLMKMGLLGSYYLMIAHGFCSSGMFYMVNLFYEQSNSRLLVVNKGLINLVPSYTFMWFLLCSSNMAAPMSLNLVGEILLLMSVLIWMKYLMILMFFFSFFSFIYSLYLFCFTQHGEIIFFLRMNNGKVLNFLVILIHWLFLNLMIFNLFIY